MTQKHSRLTAAGRLVWFVERLWYLARELPVRQVPIEQIAEFDQNCWFVAQHRRRPAGPLPSTRAASSTPISTTRLSSRRKAT
jgi:hypothetical protein